MLRLCTLLAVVLSVAYGIVAFGYPLALAAELSQKSARLGFVDQEFPSTLPEIAQLWERLRELGWVEGKNLIVERRWAEGHAERLPLLINEMVARKVDVIVTYSTRPPSRLRLQPAPSQAAPLLWEIRYAAALRRA